MYKYQTTNTPTPSKMDTQTLPLVPFGKYKDKSILDLLADEKYVEWLKQQSWFPKQTQIYNIVVHQTLSTLTNAKTPEHNRLQNLFLDENNQQKLLSKALSANQNNLLHLCTFKTPIFLKVFILFPEYNKKLIYNFTIILLHNLYELYQNELH